MFVRWKRRERTATLWGGGYGRRHWKTGKWVKTAVLVQSVRTEAGPRHKNVCYLGTIREGHENTHFHCVDFWASATKNLDAAGITGADRRKIEASLKAVVSKPGRKTLAAENRWMAELTKRLTK